jgi:hypothetical protein
LHKLLATIFRFVEKKPMSDQTTLIDGLSANFKKGQDEKGPDLRGLHPKSHGLLHGKFTVNDNIPNDYKIGVFAHPKTYDIWVRFSNGSAPTARGVLKPDTEGDVRGLAIKLLNVDGDKVLDDEKETQDFVLMNHPVFFLKDLQGYVDFQVLKSQGSTPDPALLKKLGTSLVILKEINSKKISNPLLIPYWSTTPYKLGSYSIKFLVKPHHPEQPPESLPESSDYLREAITRYMDETQESVTYDFQIQIYVDDKKTPIEDSTIEWKEEAITVAIIEIPKQSFNFEERKRLDESFSFSPWHTLPEHEPLGSVNLSRKKIYQEGAQHRRNYIEGRQHEPQPYSAIKDDPQHT